MITRDLKNILNYSNKIKYIPQLKKKIGELVPENWNLEIIELEDGLWLKNKFRESMFFFNSGQVTGIKCRFFVDFLNWIIINWNEEEKCGYWIIKI